MCVSYCMAYLNANGFALSHLILFDYDLPDMPAVQFAANVQARDLAIPLVVYRAPNDEEIAGKLLAVGVWGYVLKSESLESLADALRAAARGEPYIHPELAVRLWTLAQRQLAETWNLNVWEQEILALLGEGLKNEAIARLLNVAEQTVKNNVTSLYKKWVVENRTQLMLKARELGVWLKRTNYTGGRIESTDNFVERVANLLRRVASPTTL